MTSFALHQPYYDIKQLRPCSPLFYTQTYTLPHSYTHSHAHTIYRCYWCRSILIWFLSISSRFDNVFEQESRTIIINHRLKNAHIKTMKCDSGNVAKPHERATNFVRSSWNTVVEDVCVCVFLCVSYVHARRVPSAAQHSSNLYLWMSETTHKSRNKCCLQQMTIYAQHFYRAIRFTLNGSFRIPYLCSPLPLPFPPQQQSEWGEWTLPYIGPEVKDEKQVE